MFINGVPVKATKNNSAIAVEQQWCLKLFTKIFTWKSKYTGFFFSFNEQRGSCWGAGKYKGGGEVPIRPSNQMAGEGLGQSHFGGLGRNQTCVLRTE